MVKNRRGGYRQPKNPAPVGGNRTDGGPASKKQPLRRIPGQEYGEGKQLIGLRKINLKMVFLT